MNLEEMERKTGKASADAVSTRKSPQNASRKDAEPANGGRNRKAGNSGNSGRRNMSGERPGRPMTSMVFRGHSRSNSGTLGALKGQIIAETNIEGPHLSSFLY